MSRLSRRLVVTLDAEAQPERSDRTPLDHLIHGKTGSGEWGLWRILDIAERHGVQITVFLDYAERDLWGEGVLDAGREVLRRGHDLQLHLHPEFLAPSRFEAVGAAPVGAVADMSPLQARVAVDAVFEAHDEAGGGGLAAFRGGGYHVNDVLLSALRAAGVTADSSYLPARHRGAAKGLSARDDRPFLWRNGVTELPIGTVPGFRNLDYPKAYNFNATFLMREGAKGRDAADAAARHAEYAESFWTQAGKEAPLVLVMHSWSLLQRGEDGRFGDGSALAAETLDLVLGAASKGGGTATIAEVARGLENAALPIATLEGTT